MRAFLDERDFRNHWMWAAHERFLRILEPSKHAGGLVNRPAPPSHPSARLARLYQARYRSSYVYVFILAAAALISAAVGLAFRPAEAATTVAELLALLLILGLVLWNLQQRWHERYISYRLAAELFRLQSRLATLGWSLPGLDVSGVAARSGRGWIGWHFAAMVRAAPLPQGVLSEERLRAAQRAIEDELLADQIGFHERRHASKEHSASVLQRWGEALFFLTLLFVFVKAILLTTSLGEDAAPSLGLVAVLLPAAAAAFVGIGAYEEMEVLAEQSERMLDALAHGEGTDRRDQGGPAARLAAPGGGAVRGRDAHAGRRRGLGAAVPHESCRHRIARPPCPRPPPA